MTAHLIERVMKASLILLFMGLLTACNTGFGRSGNNDLDDLDISGINDSGDVSSLDLDPSFDEDENDYDVEVTQEIVSVRINADLEEDDTATMTINGVAVESGRDHDIELVDNENTINIVVTAENESEQTYTIVVDRLNISGSDVDTLDALSLLYVELDGGFSTTDYNYQASVNYFVNSTRVDSERTDSGSVVSISSPEDSEGTLTDDIYSDWLEIAVSDESTGDTTVTVNVRAQNTTDYSDYDVEITRSSHDALTQHYVKASNTDAGDAFGSAIAVSGTTFVVGAPDEDSDDENNQDNNDFSSAGAVYVFVESGDTWEQQAYIKAPDDEISEGDKFGTAVAIDGDLLAVGAPSGNVGTGQVHIYSRSGIEWRYEVSLDGGAVDDEFGYALALSGDYLIVGAPGWSNDRGIVYAYERQNEDNDQWEQMTITDNQGTADNERLGVSLDISTVFEIPEFVVGIPGRLGGQVSLFEYDDETNDDTWTLKQEFAGENTEASDRFGTSVAILFNRVAVGAPAESSDETGVNENVSGDEDDDDLLNAGAAYVFARESQDDELEQQVYLKATQDHTNYFGRSVALSSNMLAVGAPWEPSNATGINGQDEDDNEDRSGAVYVFEFTGANEDFANQDYENWTFQLYVKSTNTEEEDLFGDAVAFSGEKLIAGAKQEDSGSEGVNGSDNNDDSNSGAVTVIE